MTDVAQHTEALESYSTDPLKYIKMYNKSPNEEDVLATIRDRATKVQQTSEYGHRLHQQQKNPKRVALLQQYH